MIPSKYKNKEYKSIFLKALENAHSVPLGRTYICNSKSECKEKLADNKFKFGQLNPANISLNFKELVDNYGEATFKVSLLPT